MLQPIVIAHRGASGYRPEHTLAAYDLAIDLGADFIEPDLVSTRDGTLVARHENAIAVVDPGRGSVVEATTDVADRREFSSRRTTKTIDGRSITGWFTEDFTIDELRTLRARERLPLLRPDNSSYDDRFPIPTFEEIVRLVKRRSAETGRQIGVYPETKHPTYFRSIGLPLESSLIGILHSNGFQGPEAPVFIQSFEVGNLKKLREVTSLPLIQLIGDEPPFDQLSAGQPISAAEMTSRDGLEQIRKYATGIGPPKHMAMITDSFRPPVNLVEHAHEAGLLVHLWTFRSENYFLSPRFRAGNEAAATFPREHGNAESELRSFFELGIDGVSADFPDVAVKIRDQMTADARNGA